MLANSLVIAEQLYVPTDLRHHYASSRLLLCNNSEQMAADREVSLVQDSGAIRESIPVLQQILRPRTVRRRDACQPR